MTRRAEDRYGIVHRDDSYGRLDAYCQHKGYTLGIVTLSKGMEMRVNGKGARIATPFRPGHENTAASYLLRAARSL